MVKYIRKAQPVRYKKVNVNRVGAIKSGRKSKPILPKSNRNSYARQKPRAPTRVENVRRNQEPLKVLAPPSKPYKPPSSNHHASKYHSSKPVKAIKYRPPKKSRELSK